MHIPSFKDISSVITEILQKVFARRQSKAIAIPWVFSKNSQAKNAELSLFPAVILALYGTGLTKELFRLWFDLLLQLLCLRF